MLWNDSPVRPAAEKFTSSADGTHGWADVPCYAGDRAVRFVTEQWQGTAVAADIESFGLGRYSARLKCLSFSDGEWAVVLDPRDPRQREACHHLIEHTPELTFHNSAFDVPNLSRNGLIERKHLDKINDTLIHSRLAEPDGLVRKGLEHVGNRYLGTSTEDHLLAAFTIAGLTKEQGYYQFDIDRFVYLMGSASDAIMTARLREHVRRAAHARLTTGHPFTENGVTGQDALDLIEKPQLFNRIMLRRAIKGMRVDLEFLDRYKEKTAQRLDQAEKVLAEHKVRPGNANDLIAFLVKENALPAGYPMTKGGRDGKNKKPSTVAAHLETLAHPIALKFVEHKQITKVGEDYLAKVSDQSGDDGRIYPVTNTLAAVTGRASMGDPPLHQFPEDARGIVLADEGDRMTSTDWAQIEPVVIANIAGDLDIVAAYESGEVDFYQGVASAANIKRSMAKVTLLAQLYGEGLKKLALDLGIPETDEEVEKLGLDMASAESLRETIFETLPKTAALVRAKSACRPGQAEGLLRRIGRDYGVVFTISGRILPVPMGRGWVDEETGKVGPPSRAVHKAVNFHVQGSAADVLMETVIAGDAAGLGDTLYLTMHDELVTSEDSADEWAKIMQTPPERLCRLAKRVPLLRTDRADMGERWAKV